MSTAALASIPRVCDVTLVRGAAAKADAVPGLLIEVPHGATRAAHFDSLRAELCGEYAANLRDFFFVNTDVGAPEVAVRLAELFVAADPARSALVVRCLVPRTFVDFNRVIDAGATGAASAAGAVTPGVMPWMQDPADLRLVLDRYAAYRDLTGRAFDAVCGAGGTGIMLHTYAPRSVDVAVDEDVVASLRAAYLPENVDRWPLRPEVDLITHAPDGTLVASEPLAAAVRAEFEREGLRVAANEAYSLHPSTLAWVHATRHMGRTLCLEIRRDLVMRAFTPFAEMDADPAAVDRLAGALTRALPGPRTA